MPSQLLAKTDLTLYSRDRRNFGRPKKCWMETEGTVSHSVSMSVQDEDECLIYDVTENYNTSGVFDQLCSERSSSSSTLSRNSRNVRSQKEKPPLRTDLIKKKSSNDTSLIILPQLLISANNNVENETVLTKNDLTLHKTSVSGKQLKLLEENETSCKRQSVKKELEKKTESIHIDEFCINIRKEKNVLVTGNVTISEDSVQEEGNIISQTHTSNELLKSKYLKSEPKLNERTISKVLKNAGIIENVRNEIKVIDIPKTAMEVDELLSNLRKGDLTVNKCQNCSKNEAIENTFEKESLTDEYHIKLEKPKKKLEKYHNISEVFLKDSDMKSFERDFCIETCTSSKQNTNDYNISKANQETEINKSVNQSFINDLNICNKNARNKITSELTKNCGKHNMLNIFCVDHSKRQETQHSISLNNKNVIEPRKQSNTDTISNNFSNMLTPDVYDEDKIHKESRTFKEYFEHSHININEYNYRHDCSSNIQKGNKILSSDIRPIDLECREFSTKIKSRKRSYMSEMCGKTEFSQGPVKCKASCRKSDRSKGRTKEPRFRNRPKTFEIKETDIENADNLSRYSDVRYQEFSLKEDVTDRTNKPMNVLQKELLNIREQKNSGLNAHKKNKRAGEHSPPDEIKNSENSQESHESNVFTKMVKGLNFFKSKRSSTISILRSIQDFHSLSAVLKANISSIKNAHQIDPKASRNEDTLTTEIVCTSTSLTNSQRENCVSISGTENPVAHEDKSIVVSKENEILKNDKILGTTMTRGNYTQSSKNVTDSLEKSVNRIHREHKHTRSKYSLVPAYQDDKHCKSSTPKLRRYKSSRRRRTAEITEDIMLIDQNDYGKSNILMFSKLHTQKSSSISIHERNEAVEMTEQLLVKKKDRRSVSPRNFVRSVSKEDNYEMNSSSIFSENVATKNNETKYLKSNTSKCSKHKIYKKYEQETGAIEDICEDTFSLDKRENNSHNSSLQNISLIYKCERDKKRKSSKKGLCCNKKHYTSQTPECSHNRSRMEGMCKTHKIFEILLAENYEDHQRKPVSSKLHRKKMLCRDEEIKEMTENITQNYENEYKSTLLSRYETSKEWKHKRNLSTKINETEDFNKRSSSLTPKSSKDCIAREHKYRPVTPSLLELGKQSDCDGQGNMTFKVCKELRRNGGCNECSSQKRSRKSRHERQLIPEIYEGKFLRSHNNKAGPCSTVSNRDFVENFTYEFSEQFVDVPNKCKKSLSTKPLIKTRSKKYMQEISEHSKSPNKLMDSIMCDRCYTLLSKPVERISKKKVYQHNARNLMSSRVVCYHHDNTSNELASSKLSEKSSVVWYKHEINLSPEYLEDLVMNLHDKLHDRMTSLKSPSENTSKELKYNKQLSPEVSVGTALDIEKEDKNTTHWSQATVDKLISGTFEYKHEMFVSPQPSTHTLSGELSCVSKNTLSTSKLMKRGTSCEHKSRSNKFSADSARFITGVKGNQLTTYMDPKKFPYKREEMPFLSSNFEQQISENDVTVIQYVSISPSDMLPQIRSKKCDLNSISKFEPSSEREIRMPSKRTRSKSKPETCSFPDTSVIVNKQFPQKYTLPKHESPEHLQKLSNLASRDNFLIPICVGICNTEYLNEDTNDISAASRTSRRCVSRHNLTHNSKQELPFARNSCTTVNLEGRQFNNSTSPHCGEALEEEYTIPKEQIHNQKYRSTFKSETIRDFKFKEKRHKHRRLLSAECSGRDRSENSKKLLSNNESEVAQRKHRYSSVVPTKNSSKQMDTHNKKSFSPSNIVQEYISSKAVGSAEYFEKEGSVMHDSKTKGSIDKGNNNNTPVSQFESLYENGKSYFIQTKKRHKRHYCSSSNPKMKEIINFSGVQSSDVKQEEHNLNINILQSTERISDREKSPYTPEETKSECFNLSRITEKRYSVVLDPYERKNSQLKEKVSQLENYKVNLHIGLYKQYDSEYEMKEVEHQIELEKVDQSPELLNEYKCEIKNRRYPGYEVHKDEVLVLYSGGYRATKTNTSYTGSPTSSRTEKDITSKSMDQMSKFKDITNFPKKELSVMQVTQENLVCEPDTCIENNRNFASDINCNIETSNKMVEDLKRERDECSTDRQNEIIVINNSGRKEHVIMEDSKDDTHIVLNVTDRRESYKTCKESSYTLQYGGSKSLHTCTTETYENQLPEDTKNNFNSSSLNECNSLVSSVNRSTVEGDFHEETMQKMNTEVNEDAKSDDYVHQYTTITTENVPLQSTNLSSESIHNFGKEVCAVHERECGTNQSAKLYETESVCPVGNAVQLGTYFTKSVVSVNQEVDSFIKSTNKKEQLKSVNELLQSTSSLEQTHENNIITKFPISNLQCAMLRMCGSESNTSPTITKNAFEFSNEMINNVYSSCLSTNTLSLSGNSDNIVMSVDFDRTESCVKNCGNLILENDMSSENHSEISGLHSTAKQNNDTVSVCKESKSSQIKENFQLWLNTENKTEILSVQDKPFLSLIPCVSKSYINNKENIVTNGALSSSLCEENVVDASNANINMKGLNSYIASETEVDRIIKMQEVIENSCRKIFEHFLLVTRRVFLGRDQISDMNTRSKILMTSFRERIFNDITGTSLKVDDREEIKAQKSFSQFLKDPDFFYTSGESKDILSEASLKLSNVFNIQDNMGSLNVGYIGKSGEDISTSERKESRSLAGSSAVHTLSSCHEDDTHGQFHVSLTLDKKDTVKYSKNNDSSNFLENSDVPESNLNPMKYCTGNTTNKNVVNNKKCKKRDDENKNYRPNRKNSNTRRLVKNISAISHCRTSNQGILKNKIITNKVAQISEIKKKSQTTSEGRLLHSAVNNNNNMNTSTAENCKNKEERSEELNSNRAKFPFSLKRETVVMNVQVKDRSVKEEMSTRNIKKEESDIPDTVPKGSDISIQTDSVKDEINQKKNLSHEKKINSKFSQQKENNMITEKEIQTVNKNTLISKGYAPLKTVTKHTSNSPQQNKNNTTKGKEIQSANKNTFIPKKAYTSYHTTSKQSSNLTLNTNNLKCKHSREAVCSNLKIEEVSVRPYKSKISVYSTFGKNKDSEKCVKKLNNIARGNLKQFESNKKPQLKDLTERSNKYVEVHKTRLSTVKVGTKPGVQQLNKERKELKSQQNGSSYKIRDISSYEKSAATENSEVCNDKNEAKKVEAVEKKFLMMRKNISNVKQKQMFHSDVAKEKRTVKKKGKEIKTSSRDSVSTEVQEFMSKEGEDIETASNASTSKVGKKLTLKKTEEIKISPKDAAFKVLEEFTSKKQEKNTSPNDSVSQVVEVVVKSTLKRGLQIKTSLKSPASEVLKKSSRKKPLQTNVLKPKEDEKIFPQNAEGSKLISIMEENCNCNPNNIDKIENTDVNILPTEHVMERQESKNEEKESFSIFEKQSKSELKSEILNSYKENKSISSDRKSTSSENKLISRRNSRLSGVKSIMAVKEEGITTKTSEYNKQLDKLADTTTTYMANDESKLDMKNNSLRSVLVTEQDSSKHIAAGKKISTEEIGPNEKKCEVLNYAEEKFDPEPHIKKMTMSDSNSSNGKEELNNTGASLSHYLNSNEENNSNREDNVQSIEDEIQLNESSFSSKSNDDSKEKSLIDQKELDESYVHNKYAEKCGTKYLQQEMKSEQLVMDSDTLNYSQAQRESPSTTKNLHLTEKKCHVFQSRSKEKKLEERLCQRLSFAEAKERSFAEKSASEIMSSDLENKVSDKSVNSVKEEHQYQYTNTEPLGYVTNKVSNFETIVPESEKKLSDESISSAKLESSVIAETSAVIVSPNSETIAIQPIEEKGTAVLEVKLDKRKMHKNEHNTYTKTKAFVSSKETYSDVVSESENKMTEKSLISARQEEICFCAKNQISAEVVAYEVISKQNFEDVEKKIDYNCICCQCLRQKQEVRDTNKLMLDYNRGPDSEVIISKSDRKECRSFIGSVDEVETYVKQILDGILSDCLREASKKVSEEMKATASVEEDIDLNSVNCESIEENRETSIGQLILESKNESDSKATVSDSKAISDPDGNESSSFINHTDEMEFYVKEQILDKILSDGLQTSKQVAKEMDTAVHIERKADFDLIQCQSIEEMQGNTSIAQLILDSKKETNSKTTESDSNETVSATSIEYVYEMKSSVKDQTSDRTVSNEPENSTQNVHSCFCCKHVERKKEFISTDQLTLHSNIEPNVKVNVSDLDKQITTISIKPVESYDKEQILDKSLSAEPEDISTQDIEEMDVVKLMEKKPDGSHICFCSKRTERMQEHTSMQQLTLHPDKEPDFKSSLCAVDRQMSTGTSSTDSVDKTESYDKALILDKNLNAEPEISSTQDFAKFDANEETDFKSALYELDKQMSTSSIESVDEVESYHKAQISDESSNTEPEKTSTEDVAKLVEKKPDDNKQMSTTSTESVDEVESYVKAQILDKSLNTEPEKTSAEDVAKLVEKKPDDSHICFCSKRTERMQEHTSMQQLTLHPDKEPDFKSALCAVDKQMSTGISSTESVDKTESYDKAQILDKNLHAEPEKSSTQDFAKFDANKQHDFKSTFYELDKQMTTSTHFD
ncbi:hypothetical protein ANN_08710 [Periplaneta americana]|uniref:Uncharacterized protein n=1 Tax=Periplaneta americana TaxID=6978 RepID=A0ABQ8T4F0_PERAM|nr:hypothetical protein ANN_08710 [Periplaneta americana]